MNGRRHDVVIIGGGISGLTAAWRLRKVGVDLCLIEARTRVGGYVRTDHRGGFLLEKGPFNVIVRDPAFEELLTDFSDEVTVVSASESARTRYIYRRGRLYKVPTNPIGLLTTGLLSAGAKARLIRGLLLSRPATRGEDTIAQAATRRFGSEVVETLVSAAVSGILAGDIHRLGFHACFPSLARVDADATSLLGYGLKSAWRSIRQAGRWRPRWQGMVSIDGGLGALTGIIGRRLGSAVCTGWHVQAITPGPDGFRVECQTSEGTRETLHTPQLVLASGATEASRLLLPLASQAADEIASIESVSLVVINLGFRHEQIGHTLNGFGFLVPQNEPDFPLIGVLWVDTVFPHHAPGGHRLIRVFIGGARDPQAVDRNDEKLLDVTLRSLRDLLQITGDPVLVDVNRHRTAIPQYGPGHGNRVERVRRAVAAIDGMFIIGNYLEGVSLNDCVRLAAACANEVLRRVDRRADLLEPRGLASRKTPEPFGGQRDSSATRKATRSSTFT